MLVLAIFISPTTLKWSPRSIDFHAVVVIVFDDDNYNDDDDDDDNDDDGVVVVLFLLTLLQSFLIGQGRVVGNCYVIDTVLQH